MLARRCRTAEGTRPHVHQGVAADLVSLLPPFSPGGSVCFLCGPDRPGPLHHAAGEGRRPDPDSSVPQPRDEGPAGRERW